MKKILNITIITILLLTFASCSKLLDIPSEDKMMQEEVMNSEVTINMFLNGIYMSMAENSLYGSNLTMSAIECLAQRYNASAGDWLMTDFTRYDFEVKRAKDAISGIWEGLYVRILYCNDFMDVLDRTPVDIPLSRKNVLLGEAYALRAFFHFDLLRLFGPAWHQALPTDSCMPYNNTATGQLLPMLPPNIIVERILADLDTAENLLRIYDPIIPNGIDTLVSGNDVRDFHLMRNLRMNYYAVKALQARVHLWTGNQQAALDAALVVINDNERETANGQRFRRIGTDYRNAIVLGTDRVFSTEVIFGIRNRNMYSNYDAMFAPSISLGRVLAPHRSKYEMTYEYSEDDYRSVWLNGVWQQSGGDLDRPVLAKYRRPNNLAPNYPKRGEYLQPLMKLAEMYYIAAECAGELISIEKGIEYLNEVRHNRGLGNTVIHVNSLEDLHREIRKEYEKEFYGEGYLFYYLKRRNITTVLDAWDQSGSRTITIVNRFAIPENERAAR
jgi:hypothetical protein